MAPPSKKSQSSRSSKASLGNLHKPSKKPFKSKPKGKDTILSDGVSQPEAASLALQLEDDVPDFPRGGGSSLSRRELEDVREEVDAEFEVEETVLKKKTKSKKRSEYRSQSAQDDLGSLFGNAFTGKLPKYANKITLKNISCGMKLWGVISEVNEKDIVVSLPGGLRGLVRASDAVNPLPNDGIKGDVESNFLSGIHHVGQLVSCIVQQLDDDKKESGKKRIWLSLHLSLLHKGFSMEVVQEGMVLSAYVKSIEDHGYILNFGLDSFTGFMPKSDQSGSSGLEVKVGQLIQGVVKNVDKTRKLLYMSSEPDLVSRSVTKDLKGISIDLLTPGMMVDARVRSSLENGIMISFLTYFTGTVDIFNLSETFPTSKWKDHYAPNKKVNARILFIDPSTRAVGLTLNPHLVQNKAPPTLVQVGEIFDQSKIVRIDKGSGLLLEIPSLPAPTPAYVSVSDVADKEVKKLEKSFKEGSLVRVRVLGFRHLEGLATGILKTSAFQGTVFTHSDVKPGMVVKAKVIAVDSFGAIVQLGSGVKALCPLRHMSELEIAKPRKKFQVGAELVFRVLGCKSKRITVTHKKTLVKSKLEIISSYADASDGLITHGWITKIENHGCFVRFYNGVQGFAPRSELGLDPGYDISSMYHVEQVVKCRVTSSIPALRRINLSFTTKPTRIAEDDVMNLGRLVSGVVERVTPHAVVVSITSKSHIKGTISPEHLSDHQGIAAMLKSLLRPGFHFDKLLVLDTEGSNLILTAKHSLINSGSELPSDISQVCLHSVVHGYVCNLIETGCFVRFVGRLTGFAPKNKAVDDRKTDLSEIFYIGQSVRSNIVDVNSETNRMTLSLKQSVCSSTNASFIQEYFLSQEKIAKLQLLDSESSELRWADEFDIGSIVEGEVNEIKDFGVVISFQKYKDIVGFISQYHLNGIVVESGATVQAAVLDISKAERLLDLSLKPEFVGRSKREGSNLQTRKKKRRREAYEGLEVNQIVHAQVEIVKEDYLVLSIPKYNFALGYASLADYNTQRLPRKQFVNGQSIIATVAALPSSSTGGRLLLLLKSISQAVDSSSLKRTKRNCSIVVGSIVQAEITEIKPLEVRLKFGSGFHGRVHITEATDDNHAEDPFSRLKIGQTLTARIVSKCDRNRNYQWELSLKPSLLAGSDDIEEGLLTRDCNYQIGTSVSGFVYKVDREWAWVTVTRYVNAKLYILDSASEPTELEEFEKKFYVGKFLSGYVMKADEEKKLLRLVLHPLPVHADKTASLTNGSSTSHSIENRACHIREGALVGGRISKILPGVGGIVVQIDQHLYGKVHFTELTESWISDPLLGFQEGQFVKCKVLEINHSMSGSQHVDLSLRLTLDDTSHHKDTEQFYSVNSFCPHVENIEDLKPDMLVKGYVKNVTPRGCFIMLSRKIDARILLSNLSDGYIENPEKEFPVGKLVTGKVLSLEPLSKRVEVTLKTSNADCDSKSVNNALNSISIGNVISGRIKRIESYGLFVTIDYTNLVGLCHVSELSDGRLDHIETKYKAGERVTAKVLKVDKDRQRISLGMKNSYFTNNIGGQNPSEQGPDHSIAENHVFEGPEVMIFPEAADFSIQSANGKHPALDELESRASIRPLEVPLDDIEVSDADNVVTKDLGNLSGEEIIDEKSRIRTKKKAKLEREQEIEAAEERLLEKDIPRNADEFEKLIRSSPNSSFVWIKYMAFMLSLADIEKARNIAERALRTINIREESEKLNIWVAYFNLENEYGNPPEEAVVKLFQRALQYCDPKKLHLALLGMYERTEQYKLADELLSKMIKKFKHSCKVWLRHVQRLLQQDHDELDKNVTRALLCLPQHKRIKFISQTAILAFKGGFPDKGRTLFEGMLREYPTRTDLWSIYLDQEIRVGDVDVIRSLFERATSLSLKSRRIKFLFRKYLEYEKSLGDNERVLYVREKAMEYAKSLQA